MASAKALGLDDYKKLVREAGTFRVGWGRRCMQVGKPMQAMHKDGVHAKFLEDAHWALSLVVGRLLAP